MGLVLGNESIVTELFIHNRKLKFFFFSSRILFTVPKNVNLGSTLISILKASSKCEL